jgi:U4/U6 small nuclear ribonucleoprotein PRP31
MAVNVAASSTQGQPLGEGDLLNVHKLCDEIMILEQYNQEVVIITSKFKLLRFIESRMRYIAPNLSVLITTELASKLMAAAGGID